MCQLARAVYHKRQEGRTYEGVADNKELGQISKELVRYLYENFPGVREGLEYYARLALNPEKGLLPMERKDGSTFTLSGTSKPGIDEEDAGVRDRDDANLVRGEIEEAIKRSIMKKRDDWNKKGYDIDNDSNSEKIRRLARDAEQIAFNIHYLFNLWEAKGTAWKGGERVFTSRLNAEAFVHPSLRGQMKPLDALIATFRKKGGETAIVGGLSTWAKRQVEISLQGVGERGISFDQVDIIKAFNTPYRAKDMNKKDLKKEEDKYWKIEEYVKDIKDDGTEVKGYILNIPEFYPIESMGSLWDEEKVKVEGKPDKALLDYLTEGKDIPWGMVNQDLGGGYVYMASKEKVIWDAYTFNTKTDFGTEPLESALAKRGKRDYYKKIKRWIIYAQEKIRTSSRLPRIEGTKDMRRVIKASFGHVMPPDHILFPWDKV